MPQLLDNPYILAPMAGITDMPFRRLMKRMGAGCVISEFVSAHLVQQKNNPRKERYLAFHEEERPVGIQLFGGDVEMLVRAAAILEDRGVDFVDLNLGCPVPKVTRKGGGSAWLCHPIELAEMLQKVKKAISIPLTIKIRSGWDSNQINAKEIIQIAADSGVYWVAVHGRTRVQGYSGAADWDLIRDLAQDSPIPIIGNGDVVSGTLAASRLESSGVEGVMIGRGALKNPWIFAEAMEAQKRMSSLDAEAKKSLCEETIRIQQLPGAGDLRGGEDYYTKKVKKLQPIPVDFTAQWIRIRADRDANALVEEHLSLLREAYPEVRAKLAFRKFLAWYSAGYPGASAFRKAIFTTDDFKAVIDLSLAFFDTVKKMGDSSDDLRDAAPVLMSGHG